MRTDTALRGSVGGGSSGVFFSAAGVVRGSENVHRLCVQVAVPQQPAQAAAAHLCLHGRDVVPGQVQRRVEHSSAVAITAEHAVGHQHVRTRAKDPFSR